MLKSRHVCSKLTGKICLHIVYNFVCMLFYYTCTYELKIHCEHIWSQYINPCKNSPHMHLEYMYICVCVCIQKENTNKHIYHICDFCKLKDFKMNFYLSQKSYFQVTYLEVELCNRNGEISSTYTELKLYDSKFHHEEMRYIEGRLWLNSKVGNFLCPGCQKRQVK